MSGWEVSKRTVVGKSTEPCVKVGKSGNILINGLAAALLDEGYRVRLLHFSYGARASGPEADRVPRIAEALGAEHDRLVIGYEKLAGGSPLLDDVSEIAGSVAGAEYAHEWVPARNLVMISSAVAYAEANGFHYVALGNNLEESGAYPDNEEQFTHLLDLVCDYAVHEGYFVRIVSPVGHLMKHEIVALGARLGVPWHLTWSCYQGGDRHCGRCGPCYMRRTAFERNGLSDPVMEGGS